MAAKSKKRKYEFSEFQILKQPTTAPLKQAERELGKAGEHHATLEQAMEAGNYKRVARYASLLNETAARLSCVSGEAHEALLYLAGTYPKRP